MPPLRRSVPSAFLDPDFGAAGEVHLHSLLGVEGVEVRAVNSLLVLKDNSILVAVEIRENGRLGPGLMKLDAAGGLDRTFNDNTGYLNERYASDGYLSAYPSQLVMFDEGRFLSFVRYVNPKTNDYNLGCTRYYLNGERDGSFNNDGRVLMGHFPPLRDVVDSLEQPQRRSTLKAHPHVDVDGKITVDFTHQHWAIQQPRSYIVQLNSNGSIDYSFHEDGYLQLQYQDTAMEIRAMIPSPTAGWIVAGKAGRTGVVARLDAKGRLDNSFGTEGFYATAPTGANDLRFETDENPVSGYAISLENVWVTASNTLIVIGSNQPTDNPDRVGGLLFRLDQSGHPDPSFTPSYWMIANQKTSLQGIGATLTGGQYWVAGQQQPIDSALPPQGLLLRVTEHGAPDKGFGCDGFLSMPGVRRIADINVQHDGKCLVATTEATEVQTDAAKVRRFKA
ncbi:MAG: delta-60 repeat domain-containing protein [Janthinobacterium lividum]